MFAAFSGNAFYEIAAILALAAVVGAFGRLLRQPLIVSFLAVGVLVGPSMLGIVASHEKIELLAQIGISLLLFVVGLRLDLHMLRTVGPVALATGLGQVGFTAVIGFLILLLMRFSVVQAVYVSVALTFSSTIIIVKLLSDKNEIDSLHGRIAVGFLLVQDIVAILALIGLTALGAGLQGDNTPATQILVIIARGLGFLLVVALITRFILPGLLPKLAHSQELLVLFSIAWALLLAAVGDYLGFSKEVGAFLGGVSLASTGYREAIGARLVTLRDFLLLFFFINLGSRLEIHLLGAQIPHAVILSLFVLVGNPLIVMVIMGIMGYRRRTGFLAGLAVAQISEFSLILVALGLSYHHVEMPTMGLVTLVGLVTICASTYMILYSAPLYARLHPFLAVFERKNPWREAQDAPDPSREIPPDVILLGLGNYGGEIAAHLLDRGRRVLGVDFDPEALARWRRKGMVVIYGDAGDPGFIEQLPVDKTRWFVSTVRDQNLSLDLLHLLCARGCPGRIVLSARSQDDARQLSAAGAHVVLRPFHDAAEYAADVLTDASLLLRSAEDWPVALKEIRLKPGSRFAGRTLAEIPLRNQTGVSILALSRTGRTHFDLSPDFRILPGDHLMLVGTPDNLKKAVDLIEQRDTLDDPHTFCCFDFTEIEVAQNSPRIGHTLAQLRFRQDLGVTVVGIRRGPLGVTSPSGDDLLQPGDRVIVVGSTDAVQRLKTLASL